MGRRGRPPYPDILTPREWEVLALLRQNLTNEAIAARLGVTHAAAKYHVSEILSKLGVASREEAAAWVPVPAEAAREPQLRRWRGFGVLGWLRPVEVGKGALIGAAAAAVIVLGVIAVGVWRLSASGGDSGTPGPGGLPDLPTNAMFAYFGSDGAIHLLAKARGPVFTIDEPQSHTEESVLPGGRACGEFRVQTLTWSPDGQNLICTGGGPGSSDSGVVVLMNGLGEEVATYRLNDVNSVEWSPTGDAFALVRRDGEIITVVDSVGAQVAEIGPAGLGPGTVTTAFGSPLWSAQGDKLAYWNRYDTRLHVYSVGRGTELVIDRDVRPLFWRSNSELYVASGYEDSGPGGSASYEAYLFTLGATTEPEMVRVPALDSGPERGVNTDVWVSSNGAQFAVLIDGEEGPALGLLDDSGEVREIEGATVDPENRDVPTWAVSFSEDGEYLSWLSGDGGVHRAKTDGTGVEKRADVDASTAAFAPDSGLLAYNEVENDGVTLVLRDLASGKASRLDSRPMGDQGALYAVAWRPRLTGSGIVHRAQLSYVDEEGAIRLVDSAGTDDHMLAKPCPADTPPADITLSWSIRGERLAVICPVSNSSDETLFVLDGEGNTLATVPGVAFVRWPTDERLAYQTTSYLEEPPVYEVRVLQLTTGKDELLRADALLLGWPQYERIILGLSPDYNRLLGGYTYEANLIDTQTGELSRVARLDNGAQFWTNPYTGLAGFESRDQAIVIEGEAPAADPVSRFVTPAPGATPQPEQGASLAVFNMVTGQLEPIADSRIRPGLGRIPQGHVSLAFDSGSVWWVDEGPEATVIYEAQVLRGGDPGAKEVYRLPAGVLTVVHDGSLAWMEPDGPGTITAVDLGTGLTARVATGYANMAWRPFSAEYEPPPSPRI